MWNAFVCCCMVTCVLLSWPVLRSRHLDQERSGLKWLKSPPGTAFPILPRGGSQAKPIPSRLGQTRQMRRLHPSWQ